MDKRLDDIEQRLDAMDLQIASLEADAYNPKKKQLLYQYAGWAMIGLVQQRWNSCADTAALAVDMAEALIEELEAQEKIDAQQPQPEETQPEGQGQ